MRILLTLSAKQNDAVIPIDYQYFIGSWIYKIIGTADKKLAQFLHSTGYGDGSKRFKLFNYSPLKLPFYRFWKEKGLFELNGNELQLTVSFYINDLASSFINGLFMDQEVFIGDRFNGATFTVTRIETLAPPLFRESMQYRLLSGCVISAKDINGDVSYLSPTDKGYTGYFLKHLIEKHKSIPEMQPQSIACDTDNTVIGFRALGQAKSRLHTIKPYTPEQTRVRGYVYEFELTAPDYIHEMAWNCGFGEKNAMGFGWAEAKVL